MLCWRTSLLCFRSASLSSDCAFPYIALGLLGYLLTRPSNLLKASPIWPLSRTLCALSSSFAMDLSRLLVMAASGSAGFVFLVFFLVFSVDFVPVSTVCVLGFRFKFVSCWFNALNMNTPTTDARITRKRITIHLRCEDPLDSVSFCLGLLGAAVSPSVEKESFKY